MTDHHFACGTTIVGSVQPHRYGSNGALVQLAASSPMVTPTQMAPALVPHAVVGAEGADKKLICCKDLHCPPGITQCNARACDDGTIDPKCAK